MIIRNKTRVPEIEASGRLKKRKKKDVKKILEDFMSANTNVIEIQFDKDDYSSPESAYNVFCNRIKNDKRFKKRMKAHLRKGILYIQKLEN